MADERRTNMLQDAFNQIARLSGVSLNENRPINPSSNEPASNSVGMELSRFPSLRMPPGPTSTGRRPTTSTTLSSYSGFTINSANRATFSRSSSTRSQAGRKRKRTVDKPSKVIYKDLVLIPDPDEKQVPTHNARVTLETDGKVIHGFPVDMLLRMKICDQIPELLFSEFEYVKVLDGAFI